MPAGAITDHLDVAQAALYAFWIFFVILVLYLRREDRREGYPLISESSGQPENPGYLTLPYPKTWRLFHGGTATAPREEMSEYELKLVQAENLPGAPYIPTGNPILDGVGPAAYALRANQPDLTVHGLPKIVPMRVANDYSIAERDPDPRGMDVMGADGVIGGKVSEVWVDRSEMIIRYLEVELAGVDGERVLLPMPFAQIDARKCIVKVESILGSQFTNVPRLKNSEEVTLIEEDRIAAYYGGGILYAEPSRQEPLL